MESDDEREVYDEMIDEELKSNLRKNTKQLAREQQNLIPFTRTYSNSINVAVGRVNSGKSVLHTVEMVKIAQNDPNCHCIVYVNKTGCDNDATFESIKPMIKIPIIYVKRDDYEKFFTKFLAYKELYNTVKDNHLEDRIVDEQKKEIYKELHIQDLNREWLHTLVFLEDCATWKAVTKPGGYLNDLIPDSRHIQCSFFFAVQFWRSLNTDIKSNISSAYIFGKYSRQQLSYILQQTNANISSKTLWDEYTKLRNCDCLYIDLIKGDISIIPSTKEI